MTDELVVLPASEASCEDLQTIFGQRGAGAYCQRQRYKLQPKEAFSKFPVEERARRLRERTRCGNPAAETTTGLVAYLAGEPIGWVAVEPRSAYVGLLRAYRVPWEGRTEDRTDDSIWAITCLFVRAGYRGRGISHALAQAAVDHARRRGARPVEAYPLMTQPGQEIAWDEIHVGTRSIFAAAGLAEVIQPTIRRVVMRVDF